MVELVSEYSFSVKGQGRIVSASSTVERKILRSKVDVNLKDYLYIDDFCELIINIISKDKIIKNIYNVGSGVSYSNMEIAEIIKIIAKALRSSFEVIIIVFIQ